MKAIAYYASLPINDPKSLQDIELPEPIAGPRDLLVEVKAISVNPVDTKVRQKRRPGKRRRQGARLGRGRCGQGRRQ